MEVLAQSRPRSDASLRANVTASLLLTHTHSRAHGLLLLSTTVTRLVRVLKIIEELTRHRDVFKKSAYV